MSRKNQEYSGFLHAIAICEWVRVLELGGGLTNGWVDDGLREPSKATKKGSQN